MNHAPPAPPRQAVIAFACLALAVALPTQAPAKAATDAVSAVFRERATRRAACRNEQVGAAVQDGIAWLIAHQDKDGHWDSDGFMKHDAEGNRCDGPGNGVHDIGVSGLALLALLAAGDRLSVDACRVAADWLKAAFDPSTGRVRSQSQALIYEQAIATMAMAEAAALLGSERYREAAALGLRYLQAHRTKGAAWRYEPQGKECDTSVTSWCLAAYSACFHLGLDVPANDVGEALAWLDQVTDPSGYTGYMKVGQGSARPVGRQDTFPAGLGASVTAAALHARFLCGLSPARTGLAKAAAVLAALPPVWSSKAADTYYWFHGSAALAHMPSSAALKQWEPALHKALLTTQRKKVPSLGSWDPVDVWGEEAGRVCTTALAILSLSSSWRMGDTEALAFVPKAPPLRGVHSQWQAGKLGAAITALAQLPETPELAAFATAQKRMQWFVAVEVAHAESLLNSLAIVRPYVLDRLELLDEIRLRLSPLAPGKAAEQQFAQLQKDPTVRNEIQANKELRGLQKPLDAAIASGNQRQRQQMRDQLMQFINKYPRTAAAEQAKAMFHRVP